MGAYFFCTHLLYVFKYTTLACICQVFFQIFWLNKFDLFIIAILLYSNLVQIFVFLNIDSPTTCGRVVYDICKLIKKKV